MVLTDVYIEIKKLLSDELRKSWEAQGHNLTGKVIDGIDLITKETTNSILMQLAIYNYGAILDRGVSSDRIPFSGRTGRGGKSKYIEGLKSYAEKRMGLYGKEALSVAFAIAYTHKKEGLPTRASYKYSSTGGRLDWATNAIEENEGIIVQRLGQLFEKLFYVRITNRLTDIIKTFNTTKI